MGVLQLISAIELIKKEITHCSNCNGKGTTGWYNKTKCDNCDKNKMTHIYEFSGLTSNDGCFTIPETTYETQREKITKNVKKWIGAAWWRETFAKVQTFKK